MKTSNKKSTASQALLDLDEMKRLLKEESKNTVSALLNEAVKNSINEAIEGEEDEGEDEEYTISDDTQSEANVDEKNDDEESESEANVEGADEDTEDGAEGADSEEGEASEDSSEDDSESDEWSEFDKYKNEDGAIDFSDKEDDDAEADAAIIKVYKLLKDSDQIVVKKEGNRAELKDGETGAEYVIDFGEDTSDGKVDVTKTEDGEEDDADADVEGDELNEMVGMDGNDVDYNELQDMNYSDEEGELDPEDEQKIQQMVDDATGNNNGEGGSEEDYDEFESEPAAELGANTMADGYMAENKNKKARKTMKENKNNVLFEVDLGYTDSYQDKDPIEGLSNAEPAKGKNDWDAGVPKDTKKPWAGKGKSDPFKGSVNEEEIDTDFDPEMDDPEAEGDDMGEEMPMDEQMQSAANARTSAKAITPETRAKHGPKSKKHVSVKGKYEPKLDESTQKQLAKLMKENKALKGAATELKRLLQEAVLVNVNLGQVVKILQENTTTKNEKIDIINRFDKVKSINESKALYESISRELSASNKKTVTLEDKQFTANGTQKLNESKVYENPAISEIRKMMSRMDKAY